MDDLFTTAHYETGSYSRNTTFLPDPEYSRALDALVKGRWGRQAGGWVGRGGRPVWVGV